MKSAGILSTLCIISILLASGLANAQVYNTFVDSLGQKSELRIGLRYSSDYYYMGRVDSAKAPYLSPSVGYYHKSGVFVRGSFSYLTAQEEGRIDLYTLSAGYEYFGKKMAVGLSASALFFNDLSYAVQAEMSTYLNAYAGYDLTAFMVYADASLGFSVSTDVFLGAEINRTFYFFRNKIRITPAVYVNAGTQHYYQEYYTMRSEGTGSGHGKGKGGGGQQPPPTGTTEIIESDQFKLLDYEADVEVVYKINNIRFFVATTWTFPVNPATIVSDQGTYEEDLTNGFYWTSGVRLTFK